MLQIYVKCFSFFCYEKHYHNSEDEDSQFVSARASKETPAVLRKNAEEKKNQQDVIKGKKTQQNPHQNQTKK